MSEREAILHWLLKVVQLPQYIGNFLRNGYDSWRIVRVMDDEQLKQIGVEMLGHRAIIRQEIAKLGNGARIIEAEKKEDEVAMAADAWTCGTCHTANGKNVLCAVCGSAKPAQHAAPSYMAEVEGPNIMTE